MVHGLQDLLVQFKERSFGSAEEVINVVFVDGHRLFNEVRLLDECKLREHLLRLCRVIRNEFTWLLVTINSKEIFARIKH